ncbi:ABC transporter substrate-binding protein [Cellulomonas sp. HZM]|uniref:ABC transporter substrate-binding protein n=1 Tax=Cellulomonas sp. HZM TaxID=1454010 RepID=UPI0004938653|nr:extracellular solute-binding protein [Cellulomonas sp. HZM]
MTSPRKALTLGLVAVLGTGALAACGTDDDASDPAASGSSATTSEAPKPVTLEVAIDAGLSKDAIAAFQARADQFHAANPEITVKSREYTWDATTFSVELAGGTLPAVFTIPFTDGRALIAANQIADISDEVAKLPYADKFNPNVAAAGQAEDGKMWAVPIAAYSQGLHYNRALFEKAGLDPDQPPTTWAQIRADAKQIAEKTGVAGYATMTKSNTGGWILTTLAYAMGGRLEEGTGDQTTATIDTPGMRKAIDTLRTMRWTDDSMGGDFLYDWGSINQAFASGKLGMYVSGGGNYGNLFTQNQMNPDDYGLTVLPLEGTDAGVLGGGTLAAVSAKVDDATKAAAVKWIDFYYMQKLFDEDQAKTDAKTTAAEGQPVGAPQLPMFDKATYDEQQSWIKEYVNLPLDQMTGYTDHVFDQPLLPEPGKRTQDLYAALDPVMQSILTKKDADVDKLLSAAQTKVQGILDSK